jgi:hypothetical protein
MDLHLQLLVVNHLAMERAIGIGEIKKFSLTEFLCKKIEPTFQSTLGVTRVRGASSCV